MNFTVYRRSGDAIEFSRRDRVRGGDDHRVQGPVGHAPPSEFEPFL